MEHDRSLIILDLDETLVYSSQYPSENVIGTFSDSGVKYYIRKRPYTDDLLNFCFEHFDVAVWTAASREYADIIVGLLFKDRSLEFLFTQEKCTKQMVDEFLMSEFNFPMIQIKNLKKVFNGKKYNKDKILIVDDTSSTFQKNYGNAIKVDSWLGDKDDIELKRLITYLEYLLDFPESWRRIEKRYWKDKTF